MSWLCRDPDRVDQEWGLIDFIESDNHAIILNIASQDTREFDSTSTAKSSSIDASCTVDLQKISSDGEWNDWLKKDSEHAQDNPFNSSINLILSSRRSELCELPFAENRFTKIKETWKIHGSIARAINRNLCCVFDTFPLEINYQSQRIPTIVYNLRTSAAWDDDRALSITFFPESLTTKAVWYGAKLYKHNVHGDLLSEDDIISKRLSGFDGRYFHPMLLPTIFADFERERQIPLARNCFKELIIKVTSISDSETLSINAENQNVPAASPQPKLSTSLKKYKNFFSLDTSDTNEKTIQPITSSLNGRHKGSSGPKSKNQSRPIDQWVKISHIRNGLEDWRAQLVKMIEHTNELESLYTAEKDHTSSASMISEKLISLIRVGKRIKTRLRDLINEYDEAIRNCTTSMEGMSLAMQLELNNISRKDALTNHKISLSNFEVADTARRDGNLMKIIALLGMVYLPGTFVSTFFSMDFFQWIQEGDAAVVSPYIWVYALVTICLTLSTIAVFYSYIRKTRHQTMFEYSSLLA